MTDLNTGTAHAKCMAMDTHICQVPSGRRCAEQPCEEPAGTHWGPYWCPGHDKERLDRVSAGFDAIAKSLHPASTTGERPVSAEHRQRQLMVTTLSRQLTDAERAELAAFIAEAAEQATPDLSKED